MEFGPLTYALALAAGALSSLAPCVLPLIPILAGSALLAHRLGPLALAAGLGLSYAAVGLALASAGTLAGVDRDTLRLAGAAILVVFGIVLVAPGLQARFAGLAAGLGNAGQGWIGRLAPQGLPGQFAIGLVLGVIWSPCVGPTLGGAIALASQGEHLAEAAGVMLLFGLGAALPLVVLGGLSREAGRHLRGRLLAVGRHGKSMLGLLFLGLGALVATGADQIVEAWLLERMPDWLMELTVSL